MDGVRRRARLYFLLDARRELWRLHALGNPSENVASLERGERHHEATATDEQTSQSLLRAAQVLIVLAGLLLLFAIVARR
jgi:hypothetical protein